MTFSTMHKEYELLAWGIRLLIFCFCMHGLVSARSDHFGNPRRRNYVIRTLLSIHSCMTNKATTTNLQ